MADRCRISVRRQEVAGRSSRAWGEGWCGDQRAKLAVASSRDLSRADQPTSAGGLVSGEAPRPIRTFLRIARRGLGSVDIVTSTRADWVRLTEWLAERTEPVVVIRWSELEAIVGGLPESATKHYPQWWHGDRPNTRAWRRAGYELVQVDVGRTVTLRKSTTGEASEAVRMAPRPTRARCQPTGRRTEPYLDLLPRTSRSTAPALLRPVDRAREGRSGLRQPSRAPPGVETDLGISSTRPCY